MCIMYTLLKVVNCHDFSVLSMMCIKKVWIGESVGEIHPVFLVFSKALSP